MSGLANLKLAALPPVDAVVRTAAPTAEAIVERYQQAHDALVAAPIYLRCGHPHHYPISPAAHPAHGQTPESRRVFTRVAMALPASPQIRLGCHRGCLCTTAASSRFLALPAKPTRPEAWHGLMRGNDHCS